MRSVFIAGSRKFSADVERLARLCRENGIKCFTAGKISGRKDTFMSEKSALKKNEGDIEERRRLLTPSGSNSPSERIGRSEG
jgi:hypothetical protein